MRSIKIADYMISDDSPPFIVAEIGSNHGGDAEVCEKLIRMAAKCGCDAVKLQKRDNAAMFTKAALAQPYNTEYSYGATYGEHRDKLDCFTLGDFYRFKSLARDLGLIFFATAFDFPSVDFLDALDIPCFKIASCDLLNIPLIRYAAAKGKPLIISTGGGTIEDIHRVHDALHAIDFTNFAFLHCVSTYPNRDDELNLSFINTLRETFKHHVIGFSSHHPGLDPCKYACREGARIIEVHITLNRASAGTDHAFSLEYKALETLCEDLRRIPVMLGSAERKVIEQERQGFIRKMGKAVRAAHTIPAGKRIGEDDIVLKAPAEGITPYQWGDVIGKIAVHELSTAQPLRWEDFNE